MGFSDANSKEELETKLASSTAGYIASSKDLHACSSSSSSEDPSKDHEEPTKDLTALKKIDDEVRIKSDLKDLEQEVKEKREWAQKTAIQAATTLVNKISELDSLRMEKEDRELCKRMLQYLSIINDVDDMEFPIKKAMEILNVLRGLGKKYEKLGDEIQAEKEAFKLSASESLSFCSESAKREKKYLKKQKAGKKQKAKLLENIAAENEKLSEMERQLSNFRLAQREAEVKYEQERRAKELALAQSQEERHLENRTRANGKIQIQNLRQKTQSDFQRAKVDRQRLKEEHSTLLKSEESQVEVDHLCPEFENLGVNVKGECLYCLRTQVSVLFLPCAHQVMCMECSLLVKSMGDTTCPACRAPIERRINVFGPN